MPPACRAFASSMQSPSVSADRIKVRSLSRAFARPAATPQVECSSTRSRRPSRWASVAGRMTPRRPPGGRRRRPHPAGRACAMIASVKCSSVGLMGCLATPPSQFRWAPDPSFSAPSAAAHRWIRATLGSQAFVDRSPGKRAHSLDGDRRHRSRRARTGRRGRPAGAPGERRHDRGARRDGQGVSAVRTCPPSEHGTGDTW